MVAGFLLPILNKLLRSTSQVKAPFSVILVPTAELAIQVASWCGRVFLCDYTCCHP